MGAEPTFQAYRDKHLGELAQVSELLAMELSDNPVEVQNQARKAEAWYGRLTSVLAWADSYLDASLAAHLEPKEKGETDLDREKKLDAAVRQERRFRDVTRGLVDALDRRISLAQSLLKTAATEARKNQST